MSTQERIKIFKRRQSDTESPPDEYEKLLFDTDNELWTILGSLGDTIFKINNWEIYRRAAELVKDIPILVSEISRPSWKYKWVTPPSWVPGRGVDLNMLKLLQNGDVSKFNNLRSDRVNLSGTDLHGAMLSKVDLDEAQLIGSSLESADLSQANLRGADLSQANLNGAKLIQADLVNTDFTDANVQGAILKDAVWNWEGKDRVRADLMKRGESFDRCCWNISPI